MDDTTLLNRIASDPEVLTGKPVIRGTRLAVDFIVGLMGHGASESEIIAEYPGLTIEDIRACLLFSSLTLRDVTFRPLAVTPD